MEELNISVLLGKTLVSCKGKKGDKEIIFACDTGETYKLFHRQDCCESVTVEDICGDLSDLVGSPIIQAEESTNRDNPTNITPPEYQDSFTWTFYRLATAKGQVVIRWYGESNGYYSESVDFVECVKD